MSSLNTGVVGLDSCVRQVEHDGGPFSTASAGALDAELASEPAGDDSSGDDDDDGTAGVLVSV